MNCDARVFDGLARKRPCFGVVNFFGEVGRLYFLFFPSCFCFSALYYISTRRHIVSNALPVRYSIVILVLSVKEIRKRNKTLLSPIEIFIFFPSDLTDAHCPRRLILSTPSKFLQSEAFLFFLFPFSFSLLSFSRLVLILTVLSYRW